MKARKLERLRKELSGFLGQLTQSMGRIDRRRWAETYVRGLLLDGQRKSIQPMAERLEAIDRDGRDYEQALQQLVNQSPWETSPVQEALAAFVVQHTRPEGFLLLDDTGLPKKGRHSVGVARQYSGTLGKVGNCQVAVTLQYADGRDVYAVDAELYLPQSWMEDRARCRRAGVPDQIGYRPKWQLALAMLQRAATAGLRGTVLADSFFGSVTAFREALQQAGWRYCVGIDSTLKVVDAQADWGAVPAWRGIGRPPSRPAKVRAGAKSPSVQQWALHHAGDFRKVAWREGSKGPCSARFAAWPVRPAYRLSAGKEPLQACWLLVEWPAAQAAPTKFFFSNLPSKTSLKQLVLVAKSRWWVEQSYKELKGELGLDHFEGRRWQGWHHHVTLVMLAYAFLVRYRRRRAKKGAAPPGASRPPAGSYSACCSAGPVTAPSANAASTSNCPESVTTN